MAVNDNDDSADSIDERIARIRRMHGWANDPAPAAAAAVHGSEDTQADKPAERPTRVLWLGFRAPSGERKKVSVTKEHFEIGTSETADLRLLDASISSRHARIHWADGGYRVRDMHSKRGTYVNDEVVPLSHALADGDRLRLGDIDFAVSLERAPGDAAALAEPAEATTFLEADQNVAALVAEVDAELEAAEGAAADAEAAPIAYFVVRWVDAEGVEREAQLARGQTLTVGRSAACDVQIADKSVSSRHCTLAWPEGSAGAVVTDLGSTNGTFVNTRRTGGCELGASDALHLGRVPVKVVAVAFETPAEAEYREWGDEDEDEAEAVAPRFHVVFVDDRGALAAVTLSEHERQLAVGSDNCEILVTDRGLEPEHAQLTWDEGVLVVDAREGAPVAVNGQPETSAVLKNGDSVLLGALRLHVVRSMAVAERTGQGPSVEAAVAVWRRHLDEQDPDLELLFIDPEDRGGRTEVCLWGDGMVQVDRKTEDDAARTSGKANRDFMRVLVTALIRAGFPDTHKGGEVHRKGAQGDPELHAFRAESRADIVFDRHLVLRSGAYAEARDLLRAVALELAG